jgi:hypothetical protein
MDAVTVDKKYLMVGFKQPLKTIVNDSKYVYHYKNKCWCATPASFHFVTFASCTLVTMWFCFPFHSKRFL